MRNPHSIVKFILPQKWEGVSKYKIPSHPPKLFKSNKMQDAEIEYEGSVLKYVTKSEMEEQRNNLLIMTQRLNKTYEYLSHHT